MAANNTDDREHYRQRRRKGLHNSKGTSTYSNSYRDEANELIPHIGEGYRWYDYPYEFLELFLRKPISKVLPRQLRDWAVKGINSLHQFNRRDLYEAWSLKDQDRNLQIEDDEHVTVEGVWVVELFPPAELHAFERALKRNGWQRRHVYGEDNLQALELSRSAEQGMWWRVIDLQRKHARWQAPNARRGNLPPEFESVSLRAIQVGTSLTAVLARFTLSETEYQSLDREWHNQHEPIMVRAPRTRRIISLDRLQSTIWQTQSLRQNLHDAARAWLTKMVPGFFASNDKLQPTLDLLLFDQFDPLEDPFTKGTRAEWAAKADAYRAVGINVSEMYHMVSEHLPKLALTSHRRGGEGEPLSGKRVWTLWGQHEAVVDAFGDRELLEFGGDTKRAIAYEVERLYDLFVMMAIREFLEDNLSLYASSRDRARVMHKKFKPSRLNQLRKTILTLSMNLTTVHRDIKQFWATTSDLPILRIQWSPWTKYQDVNRGREPQELGTLNNRLETLHEERFQHLLETDRNYRDILSTAASLGGSVDTYRMGRLALFVALASLIVAITTLFLTVDSNAQTGLILWLGENV